MSMATVLDYRWPDLHIRIGYWFDENKGIGGDLNGEKKAPSGAQAVKDVLNSSQ